MKYRFLILLALVFLFLSCYTWQAKICFNPDELFYFKSSQELSGWDDVYGPKYYGEHRFQKPPLFYLLLFSSFRIFGANWFSARIVTVLFSILALTMTYRLGMRMFDGDRAFFGAAFFGTSVLFFRFGRIALPEMALVCFMTGAFLCAYTGFLEKGKPSLFYLSFLFMGIAFFIKGPVGFLLPFASILIFYRRNRKHLSGVRVPWLPGLLIVFAFGLLWFIPALLIHGRVFFDHFVGVEIAERMRDRHASGTALEYIRHYFGKVFFYVPVAFAEYLPWSLFAPLVALTPHARTRNPFSLQRSFLIIWIVTGFVFFTLVPTKRAHYVLSLFPALSLYLVSLFAIDRERIRKILYTLLSTTVVLYFVSVFLLFPYVFIDGVDRLSEQLVSHLNREDAPVAVSWKLDPQEIELYIDRPSRIIRERHFSEWTSARHLIGEMVASSGQGDTLFYLLMAEHERDRFLATFLSFTGRVAGGEITCTDISEDWRWRKTIDLRDFLRASAEKPTRVITHFNDAFREKVFLYAVSRRG